MKILFLLGHPAHFHLFKNVISKLKEQGNTVFILNKKKDILDELLINSGFDFHNILPEGRKDGKIGIIYSLVKRNLRLFSFCLKNKPDILVGSAVEVTHVGKLLNIPSFCVTEDDFDVVPQFSKIGFPFARHILAPKVCKTGKWAYKTISYEGYHELAYLHPDHFTRESKVVNKYFPSDEPYFILRFSKLNAYHDNGIRGINDEIATKIISLLLPFGKVYITSEREYTEEFEQYRININPIDMHHVLAFAKMYIGDSQTMAAEAGVLGVPFIRFNDFVGRIGYLNELENTYELGYGFKPENVEKVYEKIKYLLTIRNLSEEWDIKRRKMLNEKINVADFITWLISNYPDSLFKWTQWNPNMN
jgi:predicted glycosyltransferase